MSCVMSMMPALGVITKMDDNMKSTIAILSILSAALDGCVANDHDVNASSQFASSSSSTAACQALGGEVFTDCLASTWQVAVFDDVEQDTFFIGDAALPITFFQTHRA